LFLPINTSSVLLALSSLALNAYLIVRLRRHIVLDRLPLMMVAVAAGVPLGLLFLASFDQAILARVLGAFLLIYVAWALFSGRRKGSGRLPLAVGIPLGVASGALAGAFAMGGPPLVAYVSTEQYEQPRHVVTIQLLLGTSAAVRLAGIAIVGIATSDVLLLGAVGLIGAITGASIAIATGMRLPRATLRYIVLGLISATAVKLLVTG
jgi:uncharacterized membrane protein YfcA